MLSGSRGIFPGGGQGDMGSHIGDFFSLKMSTGSCVGGEVAVGRPINDVWL